MIRREASCVCGQLKVACEGDPRMVLMCHCEDCQRRTGSAFGLAAWFPVDDTKVEGESTQSTRTGDAGRTIDFHFCPKCGSTVYWQVHGMEALIAVAAGAFADPHFPPPDTSFFTKRRHEWVRNPDGIESFVEGRDSAK